MNLFDERDPDTVWMRDDLRRTCRLLRLSDSHAEFVAEEFAPWALGYLIRRIDAELRREELPVA